MADPRIHELYRDLVGKRIDRRGFVKAAAALGISAPAVSMFLKAADVRAQDGLHRVVASPAADGGAFAGQELTVQCIDDSVKIPWEEVRAEFEAATGATLTIVADPIAEAFPRLLEDAANRHESVRLRDDRHVVAWRSGRRRLRRCRTTTTTTTRRGKFPAFNFEDELPGMQALRQYDGQKYVVPYDADGQVLYYRRDLLTDRGAHARRTRTPTGKDLGRPDDLGRADLDIAEYFNGKDLGNGQPGSGVSMHLKVGGQGMFHFMSLSAPYVIGPENPKLYWFDPDNMDPLVAVRRAPAGDGDLPASSTKLGPEAMLGWALGEAWDYFLDGNAVFTYSWGDVAALAVERNSFVKGKVGTVQLPGTIAYVNPKTGEEYTTTEPNYVGNTTGGSWAGVIMKGSDVPELAYYFLALTATEAKQRFYAGRGTDGVDPGRLSQMPPEAVRRRHRQHRGLHRPGLGGRGRRGVRQGVLRQLPEPEPAPVPAHPRHLRVLDADGRAPLRGRHRWPDARGSAGDDGAGLPRHQRPPGRRAATRRLQEVARPLAAANGSPRCAPRGPERPVPAAHPPPVSS